MQGFAPNPLTIRVGDTVSWQWAANPAPHTVTFNSGKPAPADIVPGPRPGELMLGPAAFPIGPTGPVVTYDGTEQVSSGIPPEEDATYSLTFTRPGTFGYVCSLHPGMRGEVEVREAGAPLPETPAQAQARGGPTPPPCSPGCSPARRRCARRARRGRTRRWPGWATGTAPAPSSSCPVT